MAISAGLRLRGLHVLKIDGLGANRGPTEASGVFGIIKYQFTIILFIY